MTPRRKPRGKPRHPHLYTNPAAGKRIQAHLHKLFSWATRKHFHQPGLSFDDRRPPDKRRWKVPCCLRAGNRGWPRPHGGHGLVSGATAAAGCYSPYSASCGPRTKPLKVLGLHNTDQPRCTQQSVTTHATQTGALPISLHRRLHAL